MLSCCICVVVSAILYAVAFGGSRLRVTDANRLNKLIHMFDCNNGLSPNILQKGGSAVDAAIAALLCTSIINPQCAGIGGGVIFTVMDSSGKVKIINSRETVPRNVNSDLLKLCRKTTEWTMECRWIGVPGEIRGYEAAHRLYGKLPWADLFQPTIKLILFYHRYIEALKFANGLKKHIRDPNFSSDKVSISKFAPAFLISSDKTHDPQYYGKNSYLDSIGTTHVSVLAEDGSAVSVTSSINDEFGSNVLSSSTGIILNNHLNDFCGRAHNIFHGERPPSNMAPSVLKSPSKTLVIGGSGSEMIPPAVASALMNHLWFGKSLKEAIDTLVVLVDSQISLLFALQDVVDGLEALGHKVAKFYNTVNAVEKAGNCISAWSDKRKKGKAAGY
uniref:Gamma-glutamyltransferase 5-like n=1 Tax=Pundamilia nyererei TaxID=303518 RepID=A0A3B4F685_9CICH